MVLLKDTYVVVHQTAGVVRVVPEMDELLGRVIEAAEAAGRPYPHATATVDNQIVEEVVGEAAGLVRIVPKARGMAGRDVNPVQPGLVLAERMLAIGRQVTAKPLDGRHLIA